MYNRKWSNKLVAFQHFDTIFLTSDMYQSPDIFITSRHL